MCKFLRQLWFNIAEFLCILFLIVFLFTQAQPPCIHHEIGPLLVRSIRPFSSLHSLGYS